MILFSVYHLCYINFNYYIIMWVEFVVGSHLCSEGFSPGTPVFLPPQKPTFLNFIPIRSGNSGREGPLYGFPLKFPFILFYNIIINHYIHVIKCYYSLFQGMDSNPHIQCYLLQVWQTTSSSPENSE